MKLTCTNTSSRLEQLLATIVVEMNWRTTDKSSGLLGCAEYIPRELQETKYHIR